MKKIILLALLLPIQIFAQELKLDNNLTGLYSKSTTSQLRCNLITSNQFTWKTHSIDWNINYANKFSPKLVENEFINRVNYIQKATRDVEFFTTYQFNYSLLRGIRSEHWTGIGASYKKKTDRFNIGISYATLIDNTVYVNDSLNSNVLRHSLRLKFGIDGKIIAIKTEYFYQPRFSDSQDYIIYGTGAVSLFPKNRVSFVVQEVLNYQTRSSVKLIHNVSLGIGVKMSKDFKKTDQ